jgi:hypothetical protein
MTYIGHISHSAVFRHRYDDKLYHLATAVPHHFLLICHLRHQQRIAHNISFTSNDQNASIISTLAATSTIIMIRINQLTVIAIVVASDASISGIRGSSVSQLLHSAASFLCVL